MVLEFTANPNQSIHILMNSTSFEIKCLYIDVSVLIHTLEILDFFCLHNQQYLSSPLHSQGFEKEKRQKTPTETLISEYFYLRDGARVFPLTKTQQPNLALFSCYWSKFLKRNLLIIYILIYIFWFVNLATAKLFHSRALASLCRWQLFHLLHRMQRKHFWHTNGENALSSVVSSYSLIFVRCF